MSQSIFYFDFYCLAKFHLCVGCVLFVYSFYPHDNPLVIFKPSILIAYFKTDITTLAPLMSKLLNFINLM